MIISKSYVHSGDDFVVMYADVPRKCDSLAADTCSLPIGRHNLRSIWVGLICSYCPLARRHI